MKKFLHSHLLLLLLGMLLIHSSTAANLTGKLLFTAKLSGSQVTPAVTTDGFGLAAFTLNATRDSLCINMTVANLSSPIESVILRRGAAGQSGDSIIDLSGFMENNRIKTALTGAQLDSQTVMNMLQGLYYVEVRTENNPGGELRGQLMLETDMFFHAVLDTAQEVHAVTGADQARGLGTFVLSRDSSRIHVKAIANRLTGPVTAAHFHFGAPGTSGPVAIGLDSIRQGNLIMGYVDVNTAAGFLDSLMAGSIYINIHTQQNPMGEIRGQVLMDTTMLGFDGIMDTTQQITTVENSAAMGVMLAQLNHSFDTLRFHIQTDSLSGPIITAQIRTGMPGDTGTMVMDATPNVDGTTIVASITGDSLTEQLISNLLQGNVFAHITTFQNVSGELRGQFYPVIREGYPFTLEGSQEVPAVTTNATGSGFVSISRDSSNAYFAVVVDSLSGPLTAAHFHKAVRGEAGGPLLNITNFFSRTGTSDSASGYWDMRSDPPFTKEVAVQFMRDSMYVNIHTELNPAGEVRGQVSSAFECSQEVTATTKTIRTFSQATLYPNPALQELNVKFDAEMGSTGSINIYDATGREIYRQDIRVLPGENNVKLDVGRFRSGIYWMQLTSPTNRFKQTFIKSH